MNDQISDSKSLPESEQISIAQKLYERINKPSQALALPQFCLCVIGLIGSGKSTVLSQISKAIPMIIFSGDETRAYLRSKNIAVQNSLVIAHIGAMVAGRLKKRRLSSRP